MRHPALLSLALITAACSDKGGSDDTGSGDTAASVDGSYTGTFSLDVTATDGSVSDTCAGAASLTFTEDGDPQLAGTGECTFSGDLAAALPDTYTATITGERGDGEAIVGDVEFDLDGNIIVDDWTGSFEDGPAMYGRTEGAATYGELAFDYAGGFDVTWDGAR